MTAAVGIDVGGTGTKAAVVDTRDGSLTTDRERLETPHPATPHAVRETIAALVDRLGFTGPVGVALPAVVQHGVVRTAANIDPSWIGTSLPDLLDDVLPGRAAYLNDADAAGVGEMAYGEAHGEAGLVVMLTLGTGIGVSLFHEGRLVPNAELGHLQVDGYDAETRASARAREAEGLSWEDWAVRMSRYVQHLEAVLWPDLIVFGGGASKKSHKWLHLVECRTPLRTARLVNNAGIVGAALTASRLPAYSVHTFSTSSAE